MNKYWRVVRIFNNKKYIPVLKNEFNDSKTNEKWIHDPFFFYHRTKHFLKDKKKRNKILGKIFHSHPQSVR